MGLDFQMGSDDERIKNDQINERERDAAQY